MLAVHRTFDRLKLFERSLENSTTASSGCAIFKVGQASMDGHGREMYRKFDGASGDAYVTVLTHDRVQLAYRRAAADTETTVSYLFVASREPADDAVAAY